LTSQNHTIKKTFVLNLYPKSSIKLLFYRCLGDVGILATTSRLPKPSPGGEDIDGQGHHLQTAKQPRGSDPNADGGNVAAKRGNHPLPKHVALPYWEVVPQQPANVLRMVAA
jgi:hypothetical protein